MTTRGDSTRRAPSPRVRVLCAAAVAVAMALLAGRSLLADGFFNAHDNLLNVHRLFEMDRCVADGQLPCRWAPDMGFGYGLPIFNYYPPFPTLVGELLLQLGLPHIEAVKLSLLCALVLAALGMFALGRALYGDWGGALCAALFVWAPYVAIDVYVRGALAETWGLALLPWLFLTSARTLAPGPARRRWGCASAAVGGALLLSHPLSVLMAAPVYAGWSLWLLARIESGQRWRAIGWWTTAHLLAGLLAAHSLVPAYLERDFVYLDQLKSQHEWNRYENNFLSPAQVLTGTRPWGYGALGSPDSMSLFAGGLHWTAATAVALALIATRRRRDAAAGEPVARSSNVDEGADGLDGTPGALAAAHSGRKDSLREAGTRVAIYSAGIGWGALAMTLPISSAAWALVPALEFLQFPWRFLGLASLGFSLAAGGAVALAPIAHSFAAPRVQPLVAMALALGLATTAAALNWTYFQPSEMHEIPNHKLASAGQIARTRHGALDYLPRAARIEAFDEMPAGRDPEIVTLVSGEGHVIRDAERTSNEIRFRAEAISDRVGVGSLVRINTYYFPGWRIRANGKLVPLTGVDDPFGRMHLELPRGSFDIHASFGDTSARRRGNQLSMLGGFALLAWCAASVWGFWRASAGRRAAQGVDGC